MLLSLAACDREPAADGSRDYGTATHPWEIGDNTIASGLPEITSREDVNYDTEAEVSIPTLRGPALSDQDTLDPDLIPGLWVQVCVVREEKMNLYPIEEMDYLEFSSDNRAHLIIVSQGEVYQEMEGTWRKSDAGRISMGFGEYEESSSFAEMYGQNFLYVWDYDIQLGVWYARLNPQAAPQIEANLFETSRGDMQFTSVVGNSYEGYFTSPNHVDMRGMYVGGVLTMRWEDQKGNLGGFAALIVDPEWNSFDGVWWIDDYEAAPFGGPWTGTRMAAPADEGSTDAAS